MTSESNSTAQVLGFTNYGRPVMAILESLIAPTNATPAAPPDDAPSESAGDVYALIGESGPIASNLKTFAFAKARALHWSRHLGETVAVCRSAGGGVIELEESVDAHAMSADEYAEAAFQAEAARLENVLASLREIAMDVRAVTEDAQEAFDGLRAVAEIDGAPIETLAGAMRGLAETFEATAWYVLIDDDDVDMAGELTASAS